MRWYQHDQRWEARHDESLLVYLHEVAGSRKGEKANWTCSTVYTSNNYDSPRATFYEHTRDEAEKAAEDYCRRNYPNTEEDKLAARQRTWAQWRKSKSGFYMTTVMPQLSICRIFVDIGGEELHETVRCLLHASSARELTSNFSADLWTTIETPRGWGVAVAKKIRGGAAFFPVVARDRVTKEETVY